MTALATLAVRWKPGGTAESRDRATPRRWNWFACRVTKTPIYVFSSIRRGVTPEINAIGTMVLGVSLTLLIAAQFLLRAKGRQARAS